MTSASFWRRLLISRQARGPRKARSTPHHRARLGIERLEERDVPSAVSWTGYGDQHSWSDFRNWSSKHVPGPTDDVTIALAGAQVSISTPVTVNSLTLSPSGLYSSL